MCNDLEVHDSTSDQARDAQNGTSHWMTSSGGLRRDTEAGMGIASGADPAEHGIVGALPGEYSRSRRKKGGAPIRPCRACGAVAFAVASLVSALASVVHV